MSKLYIEPVQLERIINPSLDKTISKLNYAINAIGSASASSKCNVSLSSIKSNINDIKNDLQGIENWINLSISKFKKVDDAYEINAKLLNSDIMDTRVELIINR